jgi:uncharacterized membrane protein YidH (DUF202 family)
VLLAFGLACSIACTWYCVTTLLSLLGANGYELEPLVRWLRAVSPASRLRAVAAYDLACVVTHDVRAKQAKTRSRDVAARERKGEDGGAPSWFDELRQAQRMQEVEAWMAETEVDLRRRTAAIRTFRVLASICSSIGFLLAAVALRRGLLSPEIESYQGPWLEGPFVRTILHAVDLVALGIAGAIACAVVGRAYLAELRAQKGLVGELIALFEAELSESPLRGLTPANEGKNQ